MANAFRAHASHSAEYFGDTRDFWWNADFLDLMGRRLGLDSVGNALDVGCGVGHWTHLIAARLPDDARVVGVDRDPLWVDQARARTDAHDRAGRFAFRVAEAQALPFPDAGFDLVTCQTLLIHVADPAAAIGEMLRVLRPGGLLLASEPNNRARALILDSIGANEPVTDILASVRLQLVCERGKAALGEGDNSIGDRLPGLFSAAGLAEIAVFLNDKTNWLAPPYETAERRALLEERADFERRDFWIWSREDSRRYFLAGGGAVEDFDPLWSLALRSGEGWRRAVAERAYSASGAAIHYLVAGRKPALSEGTGA